MMQANINHGSRMNNHQRVPKSSSWGAENLPKTKNTKNKSAQTFCEVNQPTWSDLLVVWWTNFSAASRTDKPNKRPFLLLIDDRSINSLHNYQKKGTTRTSRKSFLMFERSSESKKMRLPIKISSSRHHVHVRAAPHSRSLYLIARSIIVSLDSTRRRIENK